jgi:hypothetical protein
MGFLSAVAFLAFLAFLVTFSAFQTLSLPKTSFDISKNAITCYAALDLLFLLWDSVMAFSDSDRLLCNPSFVYLSRYPQSPYTGDASSSVLLRPYLLDKATLPSLSIPVFFPSASMTRNRGILSPFSACSYKVYRRFFVDANASTRFRLSGLPINEFC